MTEAVRPPRSPEPQKSSVGAETTLTPDLQPEDTLDPANPLSVRTPPRLLGVNGAHVFQRTLGNQAMIHTMRQPDESARRAQPTGSPYLQRELSGPDYESFLKWLHEMGIAGSVKADAIKVAANSLAEAQQMASQEVSVPIDKKAASATKVRQTLIEKNSKKYGDEMTKEDLETLQGVLADLNNKGLGKALPAAIASLAEVLLHTFPPNTCTYVMMGNSPAPLMAWMQINGYGKSTFHLPLGGLTGGNAPAQNREGYQKLWNSEHGIKLAKYFEVALGAAVSQGKPLVFIDYTATGGSLVYTLDMVKAWLEQRKTPLDVQFFAYSEKHAPDVKMLMESGHDGVLATSIGKMERIFTRMNADKLLKNVLQLKGPASLEINDLLRMPDPSTAVVHQPAHWFRLLTLMLQEFAK